MKVFDLFLIMSYKRVGNSLFLFFWLDPKETKGQGWDFQRSIIISNPKRKELDLRSQTAFLFTDFSID